MLDIVHLIVSQLVPEGSYEIVFMESETTVDIKILADKSHVAKLIGKGGKIAKSIRLMIKAASLDSDKKYEVTIEERADAEAE